MQFACNFGRRGGVIDKYRALLHPCKSAIGAERHFAQIVIVANAGHDEILAFGSLLRRWGPLAAVLRDPFLSLGSGAIVDGELMAAFALEMSGHRVAHDAQTKKCHLCHRHLLPRCHLVAPILTCELIAMPR